MIQQVCNTYFSSSTVRCSKFQPKRWKSPSYISTKFGKNRPYWRSTKSLFFGCSTFPTNPRHYSPELFSQRQSSNLNDRWNASQSFRKSDILPKRHHWRFRKFRTNSRPKVRNTRSTPKSFWLIKYYSWRKNGQQRTNEVWAILKLFNFLENSWG